MEVLYTLSLDPGTQGPGSGGGGGQNSLILSNRNCLRSSDSPGGGTSGGKSLADGVQLLSYSMFISLSGLVMEYLTVMIPGLVAVNVR